VKCREPWDTNPVLGRLPPEYRTVPYVGARFPGSPAVAARPGIAQGANCQLYAYSVLGCFGIELPPLRSSELWADRRWTVRVPVARVRPLDLVLFGAGNAAWGAHVGVEVGDGWVLHLCAEAGRPSVWTMDEFAARERYRTVLGVKRGRGGGRTGG
jgi:hypothetical protein